MRCSRRVTSIVSLAVLALVAFASVASASPTRSEYVDEVEPICEQGTRANQGVLQGVEGMIRRGKLDQAATRFKRAAGGLEAVAKRLARVPRPPADVSRLGKWLGHAKAGVALMRKMGRTLEKGGRSMVQGMGDQLLREAKRGNAVVVGFDFDDCRLNPARFV